MLASCASSPAGAPAVPVSAPAAFPAFSAAEVAWSTAAGSATVLGVARVGANTMHTCASAEAQLVPESSFATAMMHTVFGNATRGYVTIASSPPYPHTIPPDFPRSIRRVACTPSGEYRFEAVPAGTWYLFANVVWREGNDEVPRGGSLMRRIEVHERTELRVVLQP